EMGRNQREYVLRQQLKAIKEELGEIDETGGDLDDFREKILTAKMPADVEKVASKQLERLKVMQPSSAEYTVTRTYLEWLVELPWSATTEDKLDIQAARDILNSDHYDLEKVKKRILEYLEVPFDLSKVMFVATANIMDPIPPALRDRLEVLELPGYTREEKLNISRQFLIPKQLEEHGMSKERVVFEESSVAEVIDSYTR